MLACFESLELFTGDFMLGACTIAGVLVFFENACADPRPFVLPVPREGTFMPEFGCDNLILEFGCDNFAL